MEKRIAVRDWIFLRLLIHGEISVYPRNQIQYIRVELKLDRSLKISLLISLIVFFFYSLWLGHFLQIGATVYDFISIGKRFVLQGTDSPAIDRQIKHAYTWNDTGYDGQFAYYIALDPLHAQSYIDIPAYRYSRILYPLTASFVALGNEFLIPWSLVLVNIIAIATTILFLGIWLQRKNLSPWWALVYGFYPGVWVAFQRDLTEPLAYMSVSLAVLLLEDKKTYILSGILFGLAALTRETTLLFPLAVIVYFLFKKTSTRSRMIVLTLLSLGPLIAYKIFLWRWLGSTGLPENADLQIIPFKGLWDLHPWNDVQRYEVLTIALPAVFAFSIGVVALLKKKLLLPILFLLLNIFVLIFFLGSNSYVEYNAIGRITIGVVLAAIYCLPLFKKRLWFLLCAVLWYRFWVYLPALWEDYPINKLIFLSAIVCFGLYVLSVVLSRKFQGVSRS